MPLYASAWADERSLLVAGGGGKKSSGIPNRVCVATFDGETLSEPLFSCHTDETAPQALVMFPDNSRVLCVFGGDVAVYDVTRDPDAPGGEALGEDENADPPARDETTKTARARRETRAPRRGRVRGAVQTRRLRREVRGVLVGRREARGRFGRWNSRRSASGETTAMRAGGLAVTSEIGKHADAVTGVCFSPDDDDVLLTTSAESAVSRKTPARRSGAWERNKGCSPSKTRRRRRRVLGKKKKKKRARAGRVGRRAAVFARGRRRPRPS